jgi:tetratricopeptide (TPR) repeat protein
MARRAMVIGSQCAALGGLSFLPRVAEELAEVLCDRERGGCAPALPAGPLLVDPTVEEADQAIEDAMAAASAAADTLLLAFVGHGEHVGENFYLLPRNAAWPPDSRRAVLLATRIQELLARYSALDGLLLLVDACHSGLGAMQAAEDWPRIIAQAGGRFEVLTSADEREAADGCFTASLVQLLRVGEASRGETLRCADAKELVQQACGKQVATWLAFDGRRFTGQGDTGLWLGRNSARRGGQAPLAGTPAWGQIEQLTAWFERTPQLEQLYDQTRAERCVALVGPAGQGKSTLMAALARSELADDLLPPRFVHALAFASPATVEADLARDLSGQLTLTVDGFQAAASAFQAQTPAEVLAGLGPLEQLLGVLGLVVGGGVVRLAIDGLDQLTPQAAPPIHAALHGLVGDPQLSHLRLLVSARPDVALPLGAITLELDRVDPEHLERYLHRRGVPAVMVPTVSQRAEGNWLVARLLADLAVEGDLPVGQLPAGLQDAYRQELRRAGSADPDRWAQQLRPVLGVLAAAGVGPVLPIPLLCAASSHLGGPEEPARVRDVLVQLRGLVVRGAPGTPDEHLGVFHATFADYLLTDPEVGIDPPTAHAALADAIDQLAPAQGHDSSDPLHHYAAAAQAEHQWAAGRRHQVVATLRARESQVPAANLARWTAWQPRIQAVVGPDHPDTLTIRYMVAYWTGERGDPHGALRLYQELLADSERVFGTDHRNTLALRHEIARWTGESGEPARSLQLYQEVLADSERVFGADHPTTLSTRHEVARWTGQTGDPGETLRLYREVLAAQERVLGVDHPDTLSTRYEVAQWTAYTGDPAEALELYQEILAGEERALGANHPSTLITRLSIAYWTARTGNPAEALRQYKEVLADSERVLGADHARTLLIRQEVARWTGQTGDPAEALRLYQQLLADTERVLGADHADTLTARHNIAFWTAEIGDPAEALRLYQEILADSERILGADHPATLTTRQEMAHWIGQTGEARTDES